MNLIYLEDEVFENIDFESNPLEKGNYENCEFKNCNFSNSSVNEIKFEGCDFIDCNLSLVSILKSSFQNVRFSNCKMLGLNFEDCNPIGFSITLENCILNHSSFYQANLTKSKFLGCSFVESDFSEANLAGIKFLDCDFSGSNFHNTNLEKTDLRNARNFSINPNENKVKKAKFTQDGALGLLHYLDIFID